MVFLYMDDQKKEFTGVWIPKHILEDVDLTATERMLFAEINSFDVCFMSNETFALRLGCSARTVSRLIQKLADKKYIVFTGFDGRKRNLKALNDKPVDVATQTKSLASIDKMSSLHRQNVHIDNNIDNNLNTIQETSELEDILKHWNTLYETQYRSVIGLLPNYKAARKSYSVEEIKTAINNIKDHDFWKDKMTPTILFRKKNPQGEPVDYVGNLLSHKKRTAYTYMN